MKSLNQAFKKRCVVSHTNTSVVISALLVSKEHGRVLIAQLQIRNFKDDKINSERKAKIKQLFINEKFLG